MAQHQSGNLTGRSCSVKLGLESCVELLCHESAAVIGVLSVAFVYVDPPDGYWSLAGLSSTFTDVDFLINSHLTEVCDLISSGLDHQ
jgi:hypothetical protein